jgi:D-alanyl-D-alanine endopeptidase (penicillin-binding protein 7)
MKKISQKILYSLWGVIFLSTSLFFNSKLVFAAASTTAELANLAGAVTVENDEMAETLELVPDKKNKTSDFFKGDFAFVYSTSNVSKGTSLRVRKIAQPEIMPWQLDLVSEVYDVNLLDETAFATGSPLIIKIRPTVAENAYRQIFYYNPPTKSWLPLSSIFISGSNRVQAELKMPAARVAVFSYPGVLFSGSASWYSYKKGLFTASPDYPKGSKLRVFNLENNKFVDVVVNDYGPDRNKHPERIIDLDKVAFKKIANTGQGTVKVRVEPLYIAPSGGEVLGIAKAGAGGAPSLASRSGIVIDGKTGEVIWAKNATSAMPIASLTKLLAAKVFLDLKPSLDRVVAYSKQDDDYNRRYAEGWSIARLKVSDGETMTIGDLFYSALIGSANNAVESLVRVSGLEREEFIAKMNSTSLEWGASSSRFIEPTGLSPENVSSAADYAIIANKTLEHPILEKASKMQSYEFYTKNTKKRHLIKNTNSLIAANKFKITGSKTGYLDEAGYCLMTRAVDSKQNQVIAVTLGNPNKNSSFNDTEEIINYSLKKLNLDKLIKLAQAAKL